MARRAAFALLAALLPIGDATACPLCDSAAGRQVRAGVFNADFPLRLAATLAPFPLLLLAVGWLHGRPQPPESPAR